MRRKLTIVGVAIAVMALASWVGLIEWTHRRTDQSRFAIARAPFGALAGCGPEDDVARICAFAELALARTRQGRPLTDDTRQSLRDMCNVDMIRTFSAIASVAAEDKLRFLKLGAAEVGVEVRCDALEQLWAPAASAAASAATGSPDPGN